MRYGTIPKGVQERLAAALGVVPYPMLDVLVAPLQARALIEAQRAGVFKSLARGRGAVTTVELATSLELDESCLDLVLRLLVSMGYVKSRKGLWSLTARGRKHFGEKAPAAFGDFAAFGAPQWDWISRLGEVLRTGQGVEIHRTLGEAEWPLYQRAMAEGAREIAPFIVKELPVPKGARLCLDVAGSHGLVGAALCRAHPGLRSIVLERAEALPEARRLAEEAGITDVVSFRECDVLKEGYGEGADVVVLANILHHFGPEANLGILGRARAALKPRGIVAIFDIESPGPEAGPEAAADAAALFFRITSSGACFSERDYRTWLAQSGFVEARTARSLLLPSRFLVFARA